MNPKGKHVVLLRPTPELWSVILKHRTQILYVADISMIIFKLELKPGCIVLETGTGSGSLTTSLARAVAPTGKVATFEFHEQRAELAQQDFVAHGLDHVIQVERRDTQANGFPEQYIDTVDAVFLDIPSPWLAVKSAQKCLKPNKMICSFSPCIEQVQQTCKEFNANGFKDIQTIEILLREHAVVRDNSLSAIDLMYIQEARIAQASLNTGQDDMENCGEQKKRKRTDNDDSQQKDENSKSERNSKHVLCSKPVFVAKGHTGYLTFARKPIAFKQILAPQ